MKMHERRLNRAIMVLAEIETEEFTLTDYRRARNLIADSTTSSSVPPREIEAAIGFGLIEEARPGVYRERRTTRAEE